ncbi:MAG: NADH-quinone oxidoreductase subunit [Acidimicrobiaceae bacterium]
MILHWVFLMPAIMAASFFAILAFGKRLPRKGSEIGIAAVGACFVIALWSGGTWISHVNDAGHGNTAQTGVTQEAETGHGTVVEPSPSEGSHAATAEEHHTPVDPVTTEVTWFEIGGQKFTVGTLVDGLSVMMFLVVTIISLLVHIYSTDYVGGDRRYTHYFAFLSLFTASMLMLVMSRNTVQFITSWELVGLCSFALIGHWWEEKPNSDAALKAFLTNRVGDVGLMVGMITLFWATGSFDILEINQMANAGDVAHLLLLVAACSLTAAVMSKSGQFILHTWLPDAMAGPTPVSALIHAATMVVAGIFMVARLYSVFFHGLSIGDGNLNLLAVIGGITVLGGAGLAFVQDDIKKVLAYSTVSQLGYMVMALGVGAWTAALFHLFTHAFFKAGLFLGSGSVAHSVHSFDMKKDMGGMKRFMPKTYWTFIICTVALIGIPPFAGFWSKDEILTGAHSLGVNNGYEVFLVVGILGAFMTAAYMTRCVYLTFHGEPRGAAADPHHHPHESGPRIVVPLYICSFMAIVGGAVANWPFGPDSFKLRFEHFVQPVGDYFPPVGALEFNWAVAGISTLVGATGIAIAAAYYWRGAFHGATERFRLARAGHTLLVNKYYFDHLYTGIIAAGTAGPVARATNWINQNVIDGVVNGAGAASQIVARWTYRYVDQDAVDGVVNGSGAGAEGFGQVLRRMQTGKVQQYGALLFGGAVLLAGVLVFTL